MPHTCEGNQCKTDATQCVQTLWTCNKLNAVTRITIQAPVASQSKTSSQSHIPSAPHIASHCESQQGNHTTECINTYHDNAPATTHSVPPLADASCTTTTKHAVHKHNALAVSNMTAHRPHTEYHHYFRRNHSNASRLAHWQKFLARGKHRKVDDMKKQVIAYRRWADKQHSALCT